MSRSPARRRAAVALTATASMAAGAALLAPAVSNASSHREAPYVTSDPQIDNTDVYAFTSPDDASTATLVASFSPDQSPGGGPNFFPFATAAHYNVNVDNNGDGKPDLTYRWTFKDVDRRGSVNHGTTVPGTFLYNDGPVTSLTDPNLLFRQTYDLDAIVGNSKGVRRSYRLLSNIPVAPSNVGKASMPRYSALTDEAVKAGTITRGGSRGVTSFAGQRDDSFFLDIRIFDQVYGGDFSETGTNSLAGKNVNTVAIKVPKSLLASRGDVAGNPVVGVWSTTERPSLRLLQNTSALPRTNGRLSSDEAIYGGHFQQVSRLGQPLVNEAVVPANLKDYFNRLTPDLDHTVAPLVARVQDPEVPALIEKIYGIPNPRTVPGGTNRPDLVATFLTGISKKTYPAAGVDLNGMDLNKDNAGVPSEMLRLNLATPVTSEPNRLGVLGGDLQGFPNGRRLSDDIVDIELRALEGALLPQDNRSAAIKQTVANLGDAVNANDLPFLSHFPYLADPHSGSETK